MTEATQDRIRDTGYKDHFQPEYPNVAELEEVTRKLRDMTGIATPEEILTTKQQYAGVATGANGSWILVTGPCSEPISLQQPETTFVERYTRLLQIGKASSPTSPPLHALRACGQNAKPRSAECEMLPDGSIVPSYYGDLINGIDPSDRTPDPTRMVAGALQARDVNRALRDNGQQFVSTHEALLLPYEESFIVQGAQGREFLTSCTVPWIGKRTNEPDGIHVDMLKDIENPIGIKIGPGDKPEKIAELTQKLNPSCEPGKLLYILRFGVGNLYQAPEILQSIKDHSKGALILCDPMHGNTVKTLDGRKTREVPRIIDEIKAISKMCQELGLRLHGLHLEASGRDDRVECVDSVGQSPDHTAVVDPELNNNQLAGVLEETGECFV
ncbi:hypothetical protein A3F37_02755 [Candidatus Saccharibacteria bacterium RIFCSPHIGHO2_12_FULL_41_12]|nr:MAG: hypothetical protein A3F37_02755 [Candidatus Saccharibacteria bacterium RIFCSPHIGHO2_12_FULL_41_12]